MKKKARVNQLLCLAILSLVLMQSLNSEGAPVPIEENLKKLVYRILSENSGKYVAVIRGGRVHAHASTTSRRTRFYPKFNPNDETMTFESIKFKTKFLTFDERKSKIRLGEPHNGNEKFIMEKINSVYSVLRAANNNTCFVAFDEYGELVDPCTVTITDPEVRLFFNVYD